MKAIMLALSLPVLLLAQENPIAEEAASTTARSQALELAGAFANDGFKIRDGFWSGVAEVGKPQLLQVNLFAGNAYWFTASAFGAGSKMAVHVTDEDGVPVEGDAYPGDASAAFGFVPKISGLYFVKVELLKGDKAEFALVYSYK